MNVVQLAWTTGGPGTAELTEVECNLEIGNPCAQRLNHPRRLPLDQSRIEK
jgi:hypothetical protein